ncbi:MAG TPA: GNAT family N-acetyltransferase [Candidatus Kryptonia bacterium]
MRRTHIKKPDIKDRLAARESFEKVKVEPVSKRNWNKFVELFGKNGACGNCWCMYYRLPISDFKKGKKRSGNRNAMKKLIDKRMPVGLIGLVSGNPVAWIALAPREDFPRLENSRVHKRIDGEPVWSIPCMFIRKEFRRRGVSVAILRGAIDYARSAGIRMLEAYPTIPTKDKYPDSFLWVGLYKSFQRAGFKIVDRTSKSRPMVRFNLGGES